MACGVYSSLSFSTVVQRSIYYSSTCAGALWFSVQWPSACITANWRLLKQSWSTLPMEQLCCVVSCFGVLKNTCISSLTELRTRQKSVLLIYHHVVSFSCFFFLHMPNCLDILDLACFCHLYSFILCSLSCIQYTKKLSHVLISSLSWRLILFPPPKT